MKTLRRKKCIFHYFSKIVKNQNWGIFKCDLYKEKFRTFLFNLFSFQRKFLYKIDLSRANVLKRSPFFDKFQRYIRNLFFLYASVPTSENRNILLIFHYGKRKIWATVERKEPSMISEIQFLTNC